MTIRRFFTEYRLTVVCGALAIISASLALAVGDLWVAREDLNRQVTQLKKRTAIAEAIASGRISAQAPVSGVTTASDYEPKEVLSTVIPALSDQDRYDGPRSAKVALIEYSDLECPFCKKLAPTIAQLRAEYGDQLVHVWRHYPLQIHVNAPMEAQVAECVGNVHGDAAFYSYINKVFSASKSNGVSFDQAGMLSLVTDLGLPVEQVKVCISSESTKAKVEEQKAQAVAAGIKGTPGVYIRRSDGKTTNIVGAQDIEVFRSVIDEFLR